GAKAEELAPIATYLASRGLGVLLLELRGHGTNAKEDYDWKTADEDQRKAMWAFASKDLDAAAQYLSERKELHASKLVLVGHGKGCALMVEEAIKNRNTMAAVLIQPEKKVYDFELTKELKQLDGVPTLLLVGRDTKKDMAAVQEACSPKEAEPTCEVSCLTSDSDKVLTDKRLEKTLYTWLATKL
ncbi:MAG: hypothetical protein R3F17_17510, partial [Planctomycetota bacterium]